MKYDQSRPAFVWNRITPPPSAHKTEKFWVLGEKLLLLPRRVGASGLKTGGPEPGAQSQRDIPGCPGSGHEKTPLVSQRGFVI